MGKKALFFDVDGTLLDFATHRLPDSALAALRKAHADGHRIFISTGRPLVLVNIPGLTDVGLVDGYVTLNGAVIWACGKVIASHPLPEEDVRKIVDVCRSHDFTCVYMGESGIGVANPSTYYREVFEKFLGIAPMPEESYDDILGREIFQLTPFFRPELDRPMSELLPGCEFNRWHPEFVDITARGIDKASGIEALAACFGIDMADTVAFGDGGNDIPMLRRAAIGVAMGNAADDVKAAADMVTTAVGDDGVARALEKILGHDGTASQDTAAADTK